MSYNTLGYCLKVWLTSVVVTPLFLSIIVIATSNYQNSNASEIFANCAGIFMILVIIEFVLSIPVWLLFRALVILILSLAISRLLRKWLIFFAGISLTGLALVFCAQALDFLVYDCLFLVFLISHLAWVGLGIWYYKISPDE